MAKKKKEVCPYCGKTFAYLSRHKCKIKERVEGSAEDTSGEERRVDRIKETKKNIQRNLKKDEKTILDIINKKKDLYFYELMELTDKSRTELEKILDLLYMQSKIKIRRELVDSSWTKYIGAIEDYSNDVSVKVTKINKKNKDFIWDLFNFQPCFVCPHAIDRCNETNPSKFNPQHCPWFNSWINDSIDGKSYKVNQAEFAVEDFEEKE